MIDSKYEIVFSFSLHSRRFYVAVIDARGNEIMRACDRRQRFAVLVEDSLCKILYHSERWTRAWRGFRAQYFVFNDTVSNANGEFAMIPDRTVQTSLQSPDCIYTNMGCANEPCRKQYISPNVLCICT